MIKLTVAKCPSCGASLELNKKLEKAICQYCGDTILVEDAIAKVKVEHTGTVKLSSVKDSSDKIEIIKKYIKVGKRENAITLVKEVLKENPFDLEALILENELLIKQIEFNLNISDELYENVSNSYDEVENVMADFQKEERGRNFYTFVKNAKELVYKVCDNKRSISKVDDNGEYKEYLSDLNKKIEKYEKIIAEESKKNNEKEEVAKVLKGKIDAYISYGVGNRYAMLLRKLKKITKKLGMTKYYGEFPTSIDFFKLDKVTDKEITIRDLTRISCTYSSEEPQDLNKMIEIVDEEFKKMKITHLIIKIISCIPGFIVLISGHWIIAILLFIGAFALLEEFFII